MKPIVVDLGKVSKKELRALREGHGPLLGTVEQALSPLGEDAARVPVVLLLRRKKKAKGPLDCPV